MASKNTNKVFRGEGDAMVQALVDACLPTNRPSLEAPSQPHLIGRALTPYFGSSEPLPEALEAKPTSAGNKRKGSPPNLTRARASSPKEVRQGVHSNSTSTTPLNNSGKIQRSAKSPEHGAIAMPAKAVSVPVRSKNPSRASLDAAIATATYACPGMFSSPKPETLPMPTSRLLLRAVAA